MGLSRRTRRGAVVLIPLIAAAAWIGRPVLPALFGWSLTWKGGLGPSPPPVHEPPVEFSPAAALEQAGNHACPLLLGAVLVLAGVAAGIAALVRRAPLSRRLTRFALRAGLLSLLLGIAASALLVTSDLVVDVELGSLRNQRVPADRASTPWGARAVALVGLALGVLGCLETWTFTIIDRIRGRSSTPPHGDPS